MAASVGADPHAMRVERLVIEAGEQHPDPRSAPPAHRRGGHRAASSARGLVGELIGALGGSRPGCTSSSRSAAAATSPCSARRAAGTRIVDVDRAQDVTAEFTGEDGDCNLLAHLGLDSQGARRVMRFGAADLADQQQPGQAVEVLAALDQRRCGTPPTALRQRRVVTSPQRQRRSDPRPRTPP